MIDTDWIIDHFNGMEHITRKLDEMRPAGLAVCIVSLAGLYEGILYSKSPVQSKAVLQRFLSSASVLPIDEDVCEIFGRERGRLRQRGTVIGDFDLLIASTCLRHDVTLCTNNRRHFETVEGLRMLSLPGTARLPGVYNISVGWSGVGRYRTHPPVRPRPGRPGDQ